MEYEGYLTKNEVLKYIEEAFPFIDKPPENDLYVFDETDLMRRIIQRNISSYNSAELPYEGVIEVYDELSTISQQAVQWIFPSMLRIIVKGIDKSDNLHWHLPYYLEEMDCETECSAYNFSWLNMEQIKALWYLLEYISEEHGDLVAVAQEKLDELAEKI